MRSDQVSGRKKTAIFSIIVCKIESRLSEDVRALATSWKMAISSNCRFRSIAATSFINMRSLSLERKGKAVAYYRHSLAPCSTDTHLQRLFPVFAKQPIDYLEIKYLRHYKFDTPSAPPYRL